MAGIYDTIMSGDPLLAAQQQAKARLEAERTRQQEAFTAGLQGQSREVQQGAHMGQEAGQLLSMFLNRGKGSEVDRSPEVTTAKKNIALAKEIQGLAEKHDPTSPEFATAAAAAAKKAGRTDLTLAFLGESATRRKAQTALELKNENARLDDVRAAVNGLGVGQRASWIEANPEDAKKMYNLDDKGYKSLLSDSRTERETMLKKNQAEIRKLSEGIAIHAQPAEIKDTATALSANGLDKDFFDSTFFGDGTEQQAAFASKLTQAAKREQEVAKRFGDSRTVAEISDDIVKELKDNGLLKDGEDLNASAINGAITNRLGRYTNAPSVDNPAAATAPPTVQGPANPAGAVAPPAPVGVPDFNFYDK